jgi:hypothetical protein
MYMGLKAGQFQWLFVPALKNYGTLHHFACHAWAWVEIILSSLQF